MKKVNIGLILITFALVILICMQLYSSNNKKKDKENIEEILSEYFEVYNKYSLLEKEDRDINKNIDKGKYEKYLQDMKNELNKYVFEDSLDEIYTLYKQRLDNQVLGKYMLNTYIKEISQITNYTWYKEYIIVNLKIKLTVDKDNRAYPVYNEETGKYVGNIEKQDGIDYIDEVIALKKVDNVYKIVFHNINDPDTFSFENQSDTNLLLY